MNARTIEDSDEDRFAAIAHLRATLQRAGIPNGASEATAVAYARALFAPFSDEWRAFYYALYAALAAAERFTGDRQRDRASVRELLLVIEDDLGSALFDVRQRRRIRRLLVERAVREAHLSP